MDTTAELRVSDGAPLISKKTAVKMSVGTSTSANEVLVRVTIRFEPDRAKSTDAARLPLEKLNEMGLAVAEALASRIARQT
jgi:hypothetical protein